MKEFPFEKENVIACTNLASMYDKSALAENTEVYRVVVSNIRQQCPVQLGFSVEDATCCMFVTDGRPSFHDPNFLFLAESVYKILVLKKCDFNSLAYKFVCGYRSHRLIIEKLSPGLYDDSKSELWNIVAFLNKAGEDVELSKKLGEELNTQ